MQSNKYSKSSSFIQYALIGNEPIFLLDLAESHSFSVGFGGLV